MSFIAVVSYTSLALGLAVAGPAPQGAKGHGGGKTSRFRAMDVNHDGIVTRDEWRGSDQSFRVHDWNGDGVLSGDEVRPGASRPGQDDYTIPDTYRFNDWTVSGFRGLDRDHDGRLARTEWPYDAETFTGMDADRNGFVSQREFLQATDEDLGDRFDDLDVNHDRRLSRDEWQWSQGSFAERDRNHDGVVTPAEFSDQTAAAPQQSAAYRAGGERGRTEGRQAGREDKTRRNEWDLEGQRELEQADSGYASSVGSRSDYQAGYRAAFRRAYAEAFGPRQER